MIRIEGLSKKYGTNEVLKDINLKFSKGEVCGIIGENGAGKTTLFKCISGLEDYNGKVFSDFKVLKNHIGLMLTEPFFFSRITGREYIQLLCNARHKDAENIDERNIFDLPLDQYASTYSSGMKKKLVFSAILMQENDCYIFDEPFNGVDIQSNIIITEIIHRLKDLGKTIIISSHIFATLSDTCDLIYLLSKGEVTKTIYKRDFKLLEEEYKMLTIGTKLDKLNLK